MLVHVKFTSMLIGYVAYCAGLLLFVLSPLFASPGILSIALLMAFALMASLGTYVLRWAQPWQAWSMVLSASDIAWGIGVSLVSALAGFYLFSVMA